MEKSNSKISQEQLYGMLVSRELGWQAIIFDLIKTKQLDPWDIDLALLARKYLEKVQQLQEFEEGAFFISSKVLLAAAILLRIKSELLHSNILTIDEILFDKKKRKDEIVNMNTTVDFALEWDEQNYILPRTPLPRTRKITLPELLAALDRAINTEYRRIKKMITTQRIKHNFDFILPKQGINIREKIREIYLKIKAFFSKNDKMTFTQLAGEERDERIACFIPLLHLDSQGKITLEQKKPFDEIEIWLKNKRKVEENKEK